MKIFIICPVRNASEEVKQKLKNYKQHLTSKGHIVYYPDDDNPYENTDRAGYQICKENLRAIAEADEVHIFFDPESRGTLFDLGAAFALKKPLLIVNVNEVIPTENKSFANMILEWSKNV